MCTVAVCVYDFRRMYMQVGCVYGRIEGRIGVVVAIGQWGEVGGCMVRLVGVYLLCGSCIYFMCVSWFELGLGFLFVQACVSSVCYCETHLLSPVPAIVEL